MFLNFKCFIYIIAFLILIILKKTLNEIDFRKIFQHLIWNQYIDPMVFENSWNSVISEFHLEENKWLKQMFLIHTRWIPAFFKDIALSRLMRTTSRFESDFFFIILCPKNPT
uniref:Protein FAR1-RELATED SEQUENCE n=1 Tax=Lactuca sativa TaxID=4236 RepID=A0A9R1UYJ5_LACSA|nr:hypothetical protein LSAT_V11C700381670 [Lactuca sativa]